MPDAALADAVVVRLRECDVGMMELSDELGHVVCESCGQRENAFSFDNAEKCRACPRVRGMRVARCEGSSIWLEKGFWRHSPTSSLVRECSMIRRDDGASACTGGPDVAAQCFDGHEGPMCDMHGRVFQE